MNADLLLQVVEQMEKDLALSGNPHTFLSTDAIGLIQELAAVAHKLENSGQLPNLLYRIDLRQDDWSPGSQEQLAKLLWDRVTQKVWFRIHWSGEGRNATIE